MRSAVRVLTALVVTEYEQEAQDHYDNTNQYSYDSYDHVSAYDHESPAFQNLFE